MNIKRAILCSVCLLNASFTTEAAPPVIIKIDGTLYEKGLFSGQVIQTKPITLLGSDVSFSDQLSPIQTASSGVYTGLQSVGIQGSNGTVTLSRNSSLTFTHVTGGDVTGDHLGSSIGLQFYVLGAPGTPFSWSANGGASTASNSPTTSYNDIGYSNPGLVFDWGAQGGSASGTTTSLSTTMTFAGETYSLAKITPDLEEDVFFGYSGPFNGPSPATGTLQGSFSMNVQNLSVPEPASATLFVTGCVLISARRRRNAANA